MASYPAEQQADGRELDECLARLNLALIVLGQSAVPNQPGEAAFHHHFHLRQGCTSTRKSPRMVVATVSRSLEARRLISARIQQNYKRSWQFVSRSLEARRLISAPACFIVSVIASASFLSTWLIADV